MDKPRRVGPFTWLRVLVAICLFLGLFPLLAVPTEVFEVMARMDPVLLGAALGLVTCGFAVRCWRWHWLLRVNVSHLRARVSGMSYLLGLGLGASPGKIAELAKLAYLRGRARLPLSSTGAAFMMERSGDALGVLLLMLVAAPDGSTRVALAAIVFAVASALLYVAAQNRQRPMMAAPRGGLGRADLRRSIGFLVGAASIQMRPARLGMVSTVGLAAWTLESGAMLLLAMALDLNVAWAVCAFAYGLGSIAGFASMLPGGLGATELATSSLLVLAGMAGPQAVALTLSIRAATLWYGLALGGASFTVLWVHDRFFRPTALSSPADASP